MDEIVTKLCQSTINSHNHETCITVTGAGGFGKTSLVTALCHHPVIKEQFVEGVVFIELGPQATDPSMKLSQLYHLLIGEYLKQGDINHAEQEINQLTHLYCHNLLVIIDDVWHVEDAEPIVKAFSNCKIVLTTRMNDVDQYIPTKQVVSVGPMEQSEAISLLTCGVIDIDQLSHEDVSLLTELAHDVHLWPLLLSLIKGQLCHNLKRHNLSCHEAIQCLQTKLHEMGLTAYDKNNIEKSRKHAVKICIEVTPTLLKKSFTDKIKSLILYTGIGTSVQTAVLNILWNITENEAKGFVDVLWAYGLVQFTKVTIHPYNIQQSCVEVHTVISQYVIECIDSKEAEILSPVGRLRTIKSVTIGLNNQFHRCSGIFDRSPLSASGFLQYKISEIENNLLPSRLKKINVWIIMDPHCIIGTLQGLQNALTLGSITMTLPSLGQKINDLINDCRTVLFDAHKLSRNLNQTVERFLTQRSYQNLIESLETYNSKYPAAIVAKQAVSLVKNIIPYCQGDLQIEVMNFVKSYRCSHMTIISLLYR